MNDLIKKLAEQAGFIDRGTNHTAYMSFDHEKFAELIVQECVKVAHPKLTDVGKRAAGMRLVQKRLEQHFGVEE